MNDFNSNYMLNFKLKNVWISALTLVIKSEIKIIVPMYIYTYMVLWLV